MLTPNDVAEGACQEASPASTFAYVPCGSPATTLVFHERDNYTYRMCDMCAHHNINNRGGIDRGPYTNPNAEAAPAEANVGWGDFQPEAVVEAPKFEVKYPGQPETEEPEAFRLRRNSEIERWLSSKGTLDHAKTDERDWRDKVTATLFPNPKKGTQRYDLGGGYKVKLQHTLNYTIGNKELVDEGSGEKVPVRNQVADLEERVAALGDAHRIAFEGVITWKPEVSGSAYEKLDANDPIQLQVRNMIDELLTITPGAPQLVFEEPKAES